MLVVDSVVITDTFPSDLIFEGFHATGSLTTTQLTHAQDGDIHTWTLGTVRPFSGGNIYITTTIPLTVEPATIITNTVTISVDPLETNTSNNVAMRVNEILAETVDMSVSTGLNTTPVIGSELLYYLDYQNRTNYVSAYGVVITNTLPADVSFRRAEWWPRRDGSRAVPIAPTIDGQTLSFDLGVVRDRYWYGWSGANPDYYGQIYIYGYLPESATSGTDLVNRVGIVATDEGDNIANNTAEHATTVSSDSPSRDLQVGVYRSHGATIAGQEDTYRFYVQNRGYAQIDNVVMTSTLPLSTTFVSAVDDYNNPLTPSATTTNLAGQQVLIWNLGTLMGYSNSDFERRYIYVTAALSEAIPDQTPLTVEIEAYGSQDEIPNNYANFEAYNLTAQSSTVDLSVETTFDEGQSVTPGSQIRFYAIVRNLGNTPSENVVMTSTLPTGFVFDYVSSLGTFEYDANGSQIVYTADSLQGGFSDGFNIYGYVGEGVQTGDTLVHQLEISGDVTETDLTNNSSSATATGDELVRSFTLTKEDQTQGDEGYKYLPNSQIDWRIYYHNTGNQPEQVTIIDTLPAGVTFINVEQNDNWSYTSSPSGAVWTSIEPVQPNQSQYLYIRGRIEAETAAATVLTNTVQLETESGYVISATSPITVAGPRIAVDATTVDLGTSYLNYPTTQRVRVSNAESGDLVISDIQSADLRLTVAPTALTLAAGATSYVTVTLTPDALGEFTSTITILSNSYLSGTLPLTVTSTTLLPPIIEVQPESMIAVLDEDEIVTRTLVIRNQGDSILTYSLDIETNVASTVPSRIGSYQNTIPKDADTQTYEATTRRAVSYSRSVDTDVLLIIDSNPWGRDANQRILDANDIAYDTISSANISAVTFTEYDLIIIPSIQGSTFCSRFNAEAAKFAEFVEGGGTLQLNGATQRECQFNMPDNVVHNYGTAGSNYVVERDHPIMVDMPEIYYGSSASHGYFTNLPEDAIVIAVQGTENSGKVECDKKGKM